MEYWSYGVLKISIKPLTITPTLQYSYTPGKNAIQNSGLVRFLLDYRTEG